MRCEETRPFLCGPRGPSQLARQRMTEVKGGHEAEAALWRPGTRPAPPRTGRISSSHRAPTPRALSLGARRRHTHKATSREGGRPRIEARQVPATRDGASSRPGPVRGVRQLALRRAARLHLLPPLPHHRARALALPARQQTASVWPMAGKGDACCRHCPVAFWGFHSSHRRSSPSCFVPWGERRIE